MLFRLCVCCILKHSMLFVMQQTNRVVYRHTQCIQYSESHCDIHTFTHHVIQLRLWRHTYVCTNTGVVIHSMSVCCYCCSCCCYRCRRRRQRRLTIQLIWEWLSFTANPYGTLYNLVAFLPSKWPYSISLIRSVTRCV